MDAFNHKGGYATVAIFLQENNETFNHELEKIAEVLPMIRERGKETETSTPVDLDKLLPESTDYFTYSGSLTQPDYRYSYIQNNWIKQWELLKGFTKSS